jgi:hypothetical protein
MARRPKVGDWVSLRGWDREYKVIRVVGEYIHLGWEQGSSTYDIDNRWIFRDPETKIQTGFAGFIKRTSNEASKGAAI